MLRSITSFFQRNTRTDTSETSLLNAAQSINTRSIPRTTASTQSLRSPTTVNHINRTEPRLLYPINHQKAERLLEGMPEGSYIIRRGKNKKEFKISFIDLFGNKQHKAIDIETISHSENIKQIIYQDFIAQCRRIKEKQLQSDFFQMPSIHGGIYGQRKKLQAYQSTTSINDAYRYLDQKGKGAFIFLNENSKTSIVIKQGPRSYQYIPTYQEDNLIYANFGSIRVPLEEYITHGYLSVEAEIPHFELQPPIQKHRQTSFASFDYKEEIPETLRKSYHGVLNKENVNLKLQAEPKGSYLIYCIPESHGNTSSRVSYRLAVRRQREVVHFKILADMPPSHCISAWRYATITPEHGSQWNMHLFAILEEYDSYNMRFVGAKKPLLPETPVLPHYPASTGPVFFNRPPLLTETIPNDPPPLYNDTLLAYSPPVTPNSSLPLRQQMEIQQRAHAALAQAIDSHYRGPGYEISSPQPNLIAAQEIRLPSAQESDV